MSEQLSGGYVLRTRPGWSEFTSDAAALATFARPAAGERVCDLGCGGGVLLLLLAREPTLTLHGVERLPEAAALCRENLSQGDLPGRSALFEVDLREFRGGTYDLVVSNPPYFVPGRGKESRDPLRRAARFELFGGIGEFCACAARILAPRGRFCCVFPLERAAELVKALERAGLRETRREQLGSRRLLLEAVRKGA